MKREDYGNPPFPQLRYCVRCCMPETNEGMQFDEMGICLACQSAEQKMHIDWQSRQAELAAILERYRSGAKDRYDCIIPISGGKDSIFQLHVLTKVYGMNPLAVTFNPNWNRQTFWDNLITCLEKLDVDHIMFTPKRSLVNRMAKKSIHLIGDACWHCHKGVEAFPLKIALAYRIPLLIYGESPAEHSGRATYKDKLEFAHDFMIQHSAKVTERDMCGDEIPMKELFPFVTPPVEELDAVGVVRLFIGDYFFYDAERQTEFVKKEYGWKEADVEGTYKRYKSVDCYMAGVHDYAKYIKRGFGRGTDFANQDVRAGLITREEGFELARKYDSERPKTLDYFLQATGMTEEEFVDALKKLRKDNAVNLP
jgi:N-acetyl sugar amidotransferase